MLCSGLLDLCWVVGLTQTRLQPHVVPVVAAKVNCCCRVVVRMLRHYMHQDRRTHPVTHTGQYPNIAKLAPTMHVNGDDGGDGGDKGAFVFEVSHCPQVFLSPQHTLRLQCASHLVSNDSGQSARQGSAFSHCSAFSACSCPSTDRVDACFNASPGAIAGSAYA